ncbi:MAG: hypothetical protein ACRC6N_08120, partial [Plesiomonas sp.]|uniref:hypothetical protein n=1 Tax=Plesiomonas sp. TaxID=2486279 RepID=UPI003F31DAEF
RLTKVLTSSNILYRHNGINMADLMTDGEPYDCAPITIGLKNQTRFVCNTIDFPAYCHDIVH